MTLRFLILVTLLYQALSVQNPEISTKACNQQFTFDLTKTSEWNHYWERCVGSGHGLLGLRSDWQKHLKIVHDSLGFKYVRFHGILDDDMSVVLDDSTYSFFNIDTVYDYLLSIGMRPVVELGFMPEILARDPTKTVFHYKGITSPPKDWSAWSSLVTALAEHLISRYGISEVSEWFFEVWNEPNCGFWSGSIPEYFYLMKVTSEALHAVNPSLKVGGPATCQSGLIKETLEYIKNGTFKIDFISTHLYPTDFTPVNNTVVKDVLTEVRELVGDYPLFYTEYNDGLYSDPAYHDTPYASSFIVKTVSDVHGIVDLFSWWTFTDIFEEGGQESTVFTKTDGWGLLNIYGIPKPSFRAFQLLHETGNSRISGTPDIDFYNTVGAVATHNSTHITILIWNHDIPTSKITTQTVCVTISGVKYQNPPTGVLRRIDDNNCNVVAAWRNLGSPDYPTSDQIARMIKESEFQIYQQPTSNTDSGLTFNIDIPPFGVASIVLPLPN